MTAPVPAYLAAATPAPVERKPITNVLPPGTGSKHSRTALANEVAILSHAPEGQRNHQLNTSAYNLFQLVHGAHLPYEDVANALRTTSLAIGLTESETDDTLRSAYRAAASSPRQVAQLETPGPPVATIYSAPDPYGEEGGAGDVLKIEDKFKVLNWHELFADQSEEEWIAKPLLPARRLVALFSPPKVGKSLLMLEVAVQVARGEPVFGQPVDRPHRVLYVDFENDPRGDVRTRLVAMGRTPDELDNLCYLSFPQLAFLDTYIGGLELMAVVDHYEVDVVVIDTISRAVAGEENDNDTWLGFYRHTGLLLKAAGVATIRLDHTGKDASKGMRGGSAKYGDVDAVWAMTKLTDTTFALECTANRLPITEKLLVLERELLPLRHRVTTQRVGDVLDGQVQACVDLLDEMEWPAEATKTKDGHLRAQNGAGFQAAMTACKTYGRTFSENTVKEALRFRLRRGREDDEPMTWGTGETP